MKLYLIIIKIIGLKMNLQRTLLKVNSFNFMYPTAWRCFGAQGNGLPSKIILNENSNKYQEGQMLYFTH